MLRLTPIWLTPAVYFLTNTQAQTMFVQQGTKTDSHITGSAADVHRDGARRHLRHDHNRAVASSVAFAPLRLMGIGHATATGTNGHSAATVAVRHDGHVENELVAKTSTGSLAATRQVRNRAILLQNHLKSCSKPLGA